MTPLERRVLRFIDTRLESMVRVPGSWGSEESVELQVLQLLELRLVVLAPLPEPSRDRRVQDDYIRYLSRLFPGAPPETLTSLLNRHGRQTELSSLLRRFVEQQMLRPETQAAKVTERVEERDRRNLDEIAHVEELLRMIRQELPFTEALGVEFERRPILFPVSEPPHA